jgi:excisionase family DNA binding protein
MSSSHEKQERPKQERRALSIVETSEATGLSRSSLYRAIESGTLPTVKVGGRRLVPVAAVDALLNVG